MSGEPENQSVPNSGDGLLDEKRYVRLRLRLGRFWGSRGLNQSDIDDLVQRTFITLLEKFRDLLVTGNEDDLVRLAFRISRFAYLDGRGRSTVCLLSLQAWLEDPVATGRDVSDGGEFAKNIETREMLSKVLAVKLDNESRTFIDLFMQGKTYEEIATAMRISKASLYVRQHRIFDKLKNELKDELRDRLKGGRLRERN